MKGKIREEMLSQSSNSTTVLSRVPAQNIKVPHDYSSEWVAEEAGGFECRRKSEVKVTDRKSQVS